MSSLSKLLAILIVLLGAVAGASAQTDQGEIVGTVVDAQGASVPGVTVTVTNSANGLVRTAATADNGSFRFPALPTGAYKLSAVKTGFATLVVEQVEVPVGETRTVNLTMKVASQTESVTVQGAVTIVNTETQHLGEVINQTQVTALPLKRPQFCPTRSFECRRFRIRRRRRAAGRGRRHLRIFLERAALQFQ